MPTAAPIGADAALLVRKLPVASTASKEPEPVGLEPGILKSTVVAVCAVGVSGPTPARPADGCQLVVLIAWPPIARIVGTHERSPRKP